VKLKPEFISEVCQIFKAKDVNEADDDDGIEVEEELGRECASVVDFINMLLSAFICKNALSLLNLYHTNNIMPNFTSTLN